MGIGGHNGTAVSIETVEVDPLMLGLPHAFLIQIY
jgi:hypothetical protein